MSVERELEAVQRIAVLEQQVEVITEQTRLTNEKLDELMHLKSKGIGAFWLASSLLGTGIIGFVLSLVNYFKGV